MAEEGMEIRGVHENAVDHLAESGDSLAQRVALVTAILPHSRRVQLPKRT